MVCLVFFVLVCSTMSRGSIDTSSKQELSWAGRKEQCQRSLAECVTKDESQMDSEINNRVLSLASTATYIISYGALERNTVPCSRKGASYNI